jgi:NAD(P)-dependent dehydrogenase (short-subunit alcohol dehydrogenase family)
MDVSDEASVSKAFVELAESLKENRLQLVGCVNNAGVAVNAPVECLPLDILRSNIDTNLIGLLSVTQQALPLLRAAQTTGRIVNISSFNGFLATPFSGAYCASKYAVEGLTDSLRREIRPWGVSVSLVQPGYIRTPIQEKNVKLWRTVFDSITSESKKYYASYYTDEQIQKRFDKTTKAALPVEDVVRAIVHALTDERPQTRYRVGKDGTLARVAADLFPDYLQDKIFEGRNWPASLYVYRE